MQTSWDPATDRMTQEHVIRKGVPRGLAKIQTVRQENRRNQNEGREGQEHN